MNKKVFEFFRNKEYYYQEDGTCLVFIDLDDIKEFTDLMSHNFFNDVYRVVLQPSYICVESEPICEWFGIEVEELFPKEEEE